jgi:hypothetical protein
MARYLPTLQMHNRDCVGVRVGESGPPKSATERNAIRAASTARNSLSPVRIRSGPSAKTPRKRGKFSGCRKVCGDNLWSPRLDGGERGIRTLGTFQYTRFPSVRLKPLGHLSGKFFIARRGRIGSRRRGKRETLSTPRRPTPNGSNWRRGRDSNPRYGYKPYAGLANLCLQPLGHLSRTGGSIPRFSVSGEAFAEANAGRQRAEPRPIDPSTLR